jgi:uncharacterized membrane protein
MAETALSPNLRRSNRIIFILSLIGIAMAIYVLQSFLRQSSIICLTGSGCESVRKNPASYIYDIPVPAFGLIGYFLLAILAFLRTMTADRKIPKGMLGISIFGICFVTWFTYTEIFVIRGICFWCALSALNMYAIFFLVLKSLKTESERNKDET